MRTLFILRGAPASGKSTWIKDLELDSYTISTDTLRLMYQSPVTNVDGTREISQNHDKEVWDMVMYLLEQRMKNGELIVIDATHYKAPLLNRYKNLIDQYRYRAYVVDFTDVPVEELKRRNANRGFRTVPEFVIDKMVAAFGDYSEVKKSFTIVKPEEARALIECPLNPVKVEKEKVVVFGDIHGCYTPLKQYFEQNPFSDDICYIFTGDYIDRGLENKEVLEFLLTIYNKPNVVLLEGNHEKWLKLYASKSYDINQYVNKQETYLDVVSHKVLSQLIDKAEHLKKDINRNKEKAEEIYKLLQQEREYFSIEDKSNLVEIYYEFELINVPETRKKLYLDAEKWQKQLERLQKYIDVLRHETHNTQSYIEHIADSYKEMFDKTLSLDVVNLLTKKYPVTANKLENPIKSSEFLNKTYPQIKDIKKEDLRQLCRKFSQMSYFMFEGKDYIVTHAGIPCLPTLKTQSFEFIKGVGRYEDVVEVDNSFVKNTSGMVVSIHGHRNVMCDPVEQHDGLIYNLEQKVEFGGKLAIIEITKDGIKDVSISNGIFAEPEVEKVVERTDFDLIKEMYHSKWIQVKNLDKNVISLNFTRDAFQKDHWNEHTCTARGLFVNKTNGDIVARSYPKFFNYKQIDATKPAELKQNLVFPVVGYKKENGFLGLISKYKNEVYIFTKSSDQGECVNYFIGNLCTHYNIMPEYAMGIEYAEKSYNELYNELQKENCVDSRKIKEELRLRRHVLKNKLCPMLEEGYSYIFECVDNENDPHIIKYEKPMLYLLDVVKNNLGNEFKSYSELCEIATNLNVPVKEQELEFNTWEEFENWKHDFHNGVTQWNCKHEGYVFEDQIGFRVKFKSTFYSFWKQMRTLKEIIQAGRENKKIYKTKEEIQVVKILEGIEKEELQKMSIIDIEDIFYKQYEVTV